MENTSQIACLSNPLNRLWCVQDSRKKKVVVDHGVYVRTLRLLKRWIFRPPGQTFLLSVPRVCVYLSSWRWVLRNPTIYSTNSKRSSPQGPYSPIRGPCTIERPRIHSWGPERHFTIPYCPSRPTRFLTLYKCQ